MGAISKLSKVAKEALEKKKKLKIEKKKKERTEAQKKQDKSFGSKRKREVDDQARDFYRKKYPDKEERVALFGQEFEGPSWKEMGLSSPTKYKKKKD